MTENRTIVMIVNGISTSVMDNASIIGWYMAALSWRTMMGRCEKSAGISDILKSAGANVELRE